MAADRLTVTTQKGIWNFKPLEPIDKYPNESGLSTTVLGTGVGPWRDKGGIVRQGAVEDVFRL